MINNTSCTLCGGKANYYSTFREIDYYRCLSCDAVMMDPKLHLPKEKEKERYDQHNNNVDDPGYQRFVRPLVDAVVKSYGRDAKGLDYGSGSGPVAASLLEKLGYQVALYDPFYWPEPEALRFKYDFIILCEVMEHFRDPFEEFTRLRSLLLPGGKLFCMTEIISDGLDFDKWYYKNDPTHIFFYDRQTLEWIRKKFLFSSITLERRLICFCD